MATMIHSCSYCNEPFSALRKDKCYCSRSCKQMAMVKRKKENIGIDLVLHQKGTVSKGQVINERVSSQKGNTEIERATIIALSDIKTEKQERVKPILTEESIYIPITCKWITSFYEQLDERENDAWLNGLSPFKVRTVEWISVHYRCLLECILSLSNRKTVKWIDLAELCNAFIFLCTTSYYKDLPTDYPFKKGIISVRDKLKSFCMEAQGEERVLFRLKPDTKTNLMLQRYELADLFSKISFNQLQTDFNRL